MTGDVRNVLAEYLKGYDKRGTVVIAIPKGGLVLGYNIASLFNLPLEIFPVQELGHQFNKDFPIGHVGLKKREIQWASNISIEYVNSETRRIQERIQEEYFRFTGRNQPLSLSGKTLIITDDFAYSGATLLRAIRLMGKEAPLKMIAVVPIMSEHAALKITPEVEKLIYGDCVASTL